MSAIVSLQRCSSYDDGHEALERLFEPLGGLTGFVARPDRVMVKPNLICSAARERAVQTDSMLLDSLLRQLLDLGTRPVVGDSPAWGSIARNAKTSGLAEVCNRLDVPLVEFTQGVWMPPYYPQSVKSYRLDRRVLDADKVINVPKLKAHKQLLLTCAVKNLFGTMPGKEKALWHFRAGQDPDHFAMLLLDIFYRVAPAVTIVDGIESMEGDGPINGQPRRTEILMASADGPALERIACELLGIRPARLPILRAAIRLGSGTPQRKPIQVVGTPVDTLKVENFIQPKLIPLAFSLPRVVGSIARQVLLKLGISQKKIPENE